MSEAIESILTSTKKMLGIQEDYTHFDPELITHINSVFMRLYQLGVGPSLPFIVVDEDDTWNDFLEDKTNLEAVKSYMYLKVRLLFDPPATSFVLENFQKMIDEYEWALNVGAETESIGGEDPYASD